VRLVLADLHDMPFPLEAGEEVRLLVPGAREKVVIAVPLLALGAALPLVVEAAGGVEQTCTVCGGDLGSLPARCVADA
jgi:hypothetical protein